MAFKFYAVTFHHFLTHNEIEELFFEHGLIPVASIDPEKYSDLFVGTYSSVSTQVKRYAVEVPFVNENRLLDALTGLVTRIDDGGVVHSIAGRKKINKEKESVKKYKK